jgi:subtilisin
LIKPVAAIPSSRKVTTTWGLDALKIPQLWAAGITGKDVVVGHLDTGIDGAHPAFKGAIASFAEFDLAGDIVRGAKPTDSGNHGTHTAGTIAGRKTFRGAFGVAPDARLASAMVIEGGQVIDRILAGMEWVVEQDARVISMSLGLRGFTTAFQVVIDALRRNDVLPVIAVGNEGPRTSRSPGNYDNVLSVGAIDASYRVADFSGSQNFNRPNDPLVPDLVAPGVEVLSCVPDNKYAEMNGTSMATPHIAGLAALLFQAKPSASAADVEQAILGACRLPASMKRERANRGLPDGVAAYTLLTGQPLPAPVAVVPSTRRLRTKGTVSARGRGSAKPAKPRAAAKKRKTRQ